MARDPDRDADAGVRLEPAGVPLRPVLRAAAASIALMLGAIFGLKAAYDWRVTTRTLPVPERFPSPRVQTHQSEQLQDLLAAQRRHLSEYQWADAGKTLVRVPIERAMDIIARRGAEGYAPLITLPPAPATTTGPGTPRPQRRP